MLEKTFKIDGYEITVQSATGFTGLAEDIILVQLEDDRKSMLTEWHVIVFASIISQTVRALGLPFELPKPSDSPDVLRAGMQQLFSLPKRVIKEWVRQIDLADKAPGDDAALRDADSKDPLSSGGDDSTSKPLTPPLTDVPSETASHTDQSQEKSSMAILNVP